MNLKPRFLLLTGVLVAFAVLATTVAFKFMAEGIVERWGALLAEKQVLYDRSRTLQPLIRELALARQMANSEVLRQWARRPDDATLSGRAIAELENFRLNLGDRNYFLVLRDSGSYYFNNAGNEFAGRQLRYRLDPKNPDDGWFYAIVRENRDFHINVNPDVRLGVVKLWIDVLLRDGDRVLGAVGTGLDLDRFIRQVVDVPQPGITSLFLDHQGAIQLYRDQRLIDFASVAKSEGQHKLIELLLDRPEDGQAVRELMARAQRDGGVHSRFVHFQGKRYLAGIAFIPELGWYEITLLDLDVLVPLRDFGGLLAVFGVVLLVSLALFNVVLNRRLLAPLASLNAAMDRVEAGEASSLSAAAAPGDIGRLMAHFERMAAGVRANRLNLEQAVAERTRALERLAKLDALTELLNRRGMTERLEAEIARAGRRGESFGLLSLDIDRFKEINDCLGHAAGDAAIVAVARLIRAVVRPYDDVARWGGDEFLILATPCDAAALAELGERIRQAAEHAGVGGGGGGEGGRCALTVSVGGCLCRPGESMETILQEADRALYAAKAAGRNRCVLADCP